MKPKLLIALHFHQPVGNFDSVFEAAVQQCYEPILDHFERHPRVPAAFHFSGCLLEWLEAHDAKFLERLFALVGSGQIEPMGGGFYEPILTVIPKEDAVEQLKRLSDYWVRHTGKRPVGAWLPERVWEPSLVETLAEGGVGYTILDDHHLRLAGFLDKHFSGLYSTERNGRAIGFFPSDFQLRYLIPFRTLSTVKEHFEKFGSDSKEWILTYGDDAEKFGFWPGTHKWVFEERWLDQFLTLLEDPSGPVTPVSPGTYFAEKPECKKVYIPNASYTEMLEWALPASSVANYSRTRDAALEKVSAEDVHSFVRGSLWDMFLSKYPESDQMHKHVLWSSKRARNHEAARTSTLRAQCNCAYWHGLFGGIYLPHLRHGIYSSVLDADARLAEIDIKRPRAERIDMDGDLKDEVILLGKTIQAFFRPQDGGALTELDYLPSRFNMTNVVSRWKESYHEGKDLTHEHHSESGVASPHERNVGIDTQELKNAYFDTVPMRSLRDFVSSKTLDSHSLSRFDGMELQTSAPKSWSLIDRGWKGEFELSSASYERNVEIDAQDNLLFQWKLQKPLREGCRFGTLFALSLLTPQAPDRKLYLTSKDQDQTHNPGAQIHAEDVTRIELEDRAFGFACQLMSESSLQLTTTPLHTLQRSEEGYEKVYQGTLFALSWPADSKTISLKVSFRRIFG